MRTRRRPVNINFEDFPPTPRIHLENPKVPEFSDSSFRNGAPNEYVVLTSGHSAFPTDHESADRRCTARASLVCAPCIAPDCCLFLGAHSMNSLLCKHPISRRLLPGAQVINFLRMEVILLTKISRGDTTGHLLSCGRVVFLKRRATNVTAFPLLSIGR